MEIWKQLLGNLVRYFLIWLFGVFTSRGIIDADTAAKLADSGAFWLVTALLLIAPLVWQWGKVRWNNKFAVALHKADAETPKSDIKRQVLKENKFIIPI